jgi:predicted amidohydrolase YtcJ
MDAARSDLASLFRKLSILPHHTYVRCRPRQSISTFEDCHGTKKQSRGNQEPNVPPLLTCYQTLQMGTIAGARYAHMDGKAGTLTPGKEADIVILEARKAINTVGVFNIPGAVVTLCR